VLPGIIGSMQANEVLKIILNLGTTLSGKLLCYNALTAQTSTLKLKKNDAVYQSVYKNKESFHKTKIAFNCGVEVVTASIKDFLSNKNVQFIDVREPNEQPKIKDLEVTNIPLSQLQQHLDKIDSSKKKAIFCQSGIRSKHTVEILQELEIQNCFSINEGASDIKNYLKEHYKNFIK
jgi:adenylyltransferase/sulfurtransferase